MLPPSVLDGKRSYPGGRLPRSCGPVPFRVRLGVSMYFKMWWMVRSEVGIRRFVLPQPVGVLNAFKCASVWASASAFWQLLGSSSLHLYIYIIYKYISKSGLVCPPLTTPEGHSLHVSHSLACVPAFWQVLRSKRDIVLPVSAFWQILNSYSFVWGLRWCTLFFK